MHGGFLLAMWIDFAFNNIQFLYRHYVICTIISAIYMILFVYYELSTNKDVYPDVNSKNLLSFVILFLLFGVQALHFYFGKIFYEYKQRYTQSKQSIVVNDN